MGDDNRSHHTYERVVVSGEGETAREIHIYGSGGRLILEGWQVADDGGQTAWISDAGAIAVFGQPLYPGETTEAGPLWLFDNFSEVKEMGSCSPPFMAEVARALGERYEPRLGRRRDHLADFSPAADGRLFAVCGTANCPRSPPHRRIWAKARELALTPAVQASPLARRPYGPAARLPVQSTWLNGCVYLTRVAEWAGHSVDVLLRISGEYIAGQDELAKRRIDEALHRSQGMVCGFHGWG